ncbi:MAG: TonB family protein [Acidobacteriota bacterium]|nr:TonB family protein [Acidobacteriota bacterium]
MKRVFFTGMLLLPSLNAASIGGAVYDPSGGVVPQAKITLSNPVTGDKQSAATSASGGFNFADLVAGQYLLQIEKAGFAPVYKAFTVDADTNVHPSVVLSMGAVVENVTVSERGTPAAASPGPKRIRVGGNVQAANLITKVQPVYPADQKAQGIQGTVAIKAEISRDGVPLELTVLSAPSEELANASLDAVRQWRYRPTLLNGDPVEVETQINVNFTLLP